MTQDDDAGSRMRGIADIKTPTSTGDRLRGWLSAGTLVLALALLAATFLLMSPPGKGGYPGAIEWGPASALKAVTDLMSLNYSAATVRGVEIKDLAFHLAAVLGLIFLAGRALVSAQYPAGRRTAKRAWFIGQAFLAGWVLLAALSSKWSGDASMSLGQAILYGLALAWAISLSWSIESRDVPRLLWGYVAIAAVGSALCVCYFYFRNPYHRPGFPIGNPGALAACILPALLIAGGVVLGEVWQSDKEKRGLAWKRMGPALAALAPLIWCFCLAWARGAVLALIGGAAGVLFLRVRPRWRWGIIFTGIGLVWLGAWHYPTATQDIAMGRGATVRFRLYSWRYAAALWGQHQFAGAGAGAYPRMSGAMSIGDRMLDPAAFMGEIVEHAHNELFEVFAEIGLVGGVTWVAGFLATLTAASALLRVNMSPERRQLLTGLTAGVIALLADSMFTVNLRLPGTPAVFYTLLGVLWASGRSVSKYRMDEAPNSLDAMIKRMGLRRYGVTGVALVLAGFAHMFTTRNWEGVRAEYEADQAWRAGDYGEAVLQARQAGGLLLDPVRQLAARKLEAESQFGRAQAAYKEVIAREIKERGARSADSYDETQVMVDETFERIEEALRATLMMNRTAPNVGRMSALGAQCAEMAADLSFRIGDRENVRGWQTKALQAWRSQLAMRPFDMQALLRMTEYSQLYRSLPGDYVGLLRDALRNGFPPRQWHEALEKGVELPRFGEAIEAIRLSAGPYEPDTNLDALILSRAPEMYRLSAAWLALNGDYEEAYEEAGRAARLYEPMRSRFPTLYSVAVAERAEYASAAWPEDMDRAIALMREALHALPRIQLQQYAAMAAPYQARLARFLNAAGNMQEAGELIRAVLRVDPNNMTAWATVMESLGESGDVKTARSALRDAERAGVSEADLAALRGILERKLPEALTPEED